MAEKKKKTDLVLAEDDADFQHEMSQRLPVLRPTHPVARQQQDAKRIRKINPMGMRVVVCVRKDADQTEGGLYLPEGAKQAMQESLLVEVIEVASALDDDSNEEHNVSGIPLGALVLIPKNAGTKVPWDDTLRIVETKEVLAIVNEMEIT